jgi:uridine kinase
MNILAVLYGPPAVGKSTLSQEISQQLKKNNVRVKYYSWDDSLAKLKHEGDLTNKVILETTKSLLKEVIKYITLDNQKNEVILIDGVFALSKEQQLVNSLQAWLDKIIWFKLWCNEKEQIIRNCSRNPQGRLSEERVKQVRDEFMTYKDEVLSNNINTDLPVANNVLVIVNKILSKDEINFTESYLWQQSQKLRYDQRDLIKIGKSYYYKDEDTYYCTSYFDLSINNELLDNIQFIGSNIKLQYKYVNISSKAYKIFKDYSDDNNEIKLVIADKWKSPRICISTKQGIDYYIKSRPNKLLRTFKKINKRSIDQVISYSNTIENWTKALKIDSESWKGRMKSDMRSLQNEDMQYLPFILSDQNNTSLLVKYGRNDEMYASYSLMIRSGPGFQWYSVKWGCTDKGRTIGLGIDVLFHHIKYLYHEHIEKGWCEDFQIDLWGRRSEIYDQFATDYIERAHLIMIIK